MPYPIAFDVSRLSQEMIHNAFPVQARRSTEKCDGNPWLQQGSRSPVLIHGEENAVWEARSALTVGQIAHYATAAGIVDLNREGIAMALDRRVALFFQQAILCYRMPFVFSSRTADTQIGTASSIQLSGPGTNQKVKHKREAAHSSTIPTLLARPKQGGPEFVYLKGGTSYAQHNATIGMHEQVNGADELLDGKQNQEGLRSSAIKILNLVADGLNPIQATRDFLARFEEHAHQKMASLQDTDARKKVLEMYRHGVQAMRQRVGHDPRFFDQLLGVVMDPSDPDEPLLRRAIYQKRYDMIRLQEVVESRIGKRIADRKAEIGSRDRGLIEFILLQEFSGSERTILEKLFGKTAAVFESAYEAQLQGQQRSALKSFKTRVENLRAKHRPLLDQLKRDLRGDFRELSSAEFDYRAQVFKDLRTARRWTQVQFCGQHLQKTGKKVSQAWVSRMEQPSRIDTKLVYLTPENQRKRYVTLLDAEECAKTFRIDPGLFLPCLFTTG